MSDTGAVSTNSASICAGCGEYIDNCLMPSGRPQAHAAGAEPSTATGHGPSYYRETGIQPWDAMAAWMPRQQFIGFLRGNAIKYLARAGRKGNASDARRDYEKAQHYQQKLLEVLESDPCDAQVDHEPRS